MAESLDPTLLTRLTQLLHPNWARTVLARRIVAGALVVLAGIAALRPDPQGDRRDVVIAARDLRPGLALGADDVAVDSRLSSTVPDGAAGGLTAVLGASLAGPARRGEILTDVRLLGERLAVAAAGPDARMVPVHPADASLIDLLRPGDVVDVVAAPTGDVHADPRVIATGGIVVLVSEKQQRAADDRVVLVALPATTATAVAGAALVQAVTLTLR